MVSKTFVSYPGEPAADSSRPRVRPARKTDVDAIRAVASRTWLHTYGGVIAEDAISDVLDRSYTRDAVRHYLETRGMSLHVAELDSTVVGFVTHCSTSESVHDVFAIYVDPTVQGGGVGWALWKAVLQTARDSGTTAIELWVLEQNPVSRNWYERQGGVIVGRQVRSFSDGPQTELRYRFELGPGADPGPRRVFTRAVLAIPSFVGLKGLRP